jgi:hypothetical protein
MGPTEASFLQAAKRATQSTKAIVFLITGEVFIRFDKLKTF